MDKNRVELRRLITERNPRRERKEHVIVVVTVVVFVKAVNIIFIITIINIIFTVSWFYLYIIGIDRYTVSRQAGRPHTRCSLASS